MTNISNNITRRKMTLRLSAQVNENNLYLSKNVRVNNSGTSQGTNQNILIIGGSEEEWDAHHISPNLNLTSCNVVVIEHGNSSYIRYSEKLKNRGCDIYDVDSPEIKESIDSFASNLFEKANKSALFINTMKMSAQEVAFIISNLYEHIFTKINNNKKIRISNHLQIYIKDISCISYIKDFDYIIACQRSYNVGSSILLNKIEELERICLKSHKEIINNCDIKVVMDNSFKYLTEKYLQEMRTGIKWDKEILPNECIISIRGYGTCIDEKLR